MKLTKGIVTRQIQNSYDKWFEVVEQSIKRFQRSRIRQKLGEMQDS